MEALDRLLREPARLELWLRAYSAGIIWLLAFFVGVPPTLLTLGIFYLVVLPGRYLVERNGGAREREAARIFQVLLDLLIISVVVSASGALSTLFVMFYPLLVCHVTMAWGRRLGAWATIGATLAYLGLLAGVYWNVLPYNIFVHSPDALDIWIRDNRIWETLPRWTPFAVGGGLVGVSNAFTHLFVASVVRAREETAKRLEANMHLFESMAEEAPVGIHRTSAAGVCLYANGPLCELLGRPREEVQGHGWRAHFHPEDAGQIEAKFVAAVATGRPFDGEHRMCRGDGTAVWTVARGEPEFDEKGRLRGFVGTLADITLRKNAERLLAGVAQAAHELLMNPGLDEAINRSLAIVGEAAEVDRIAIFAGHSHPRTGKKVFSYRYEWCAPSVRPHLKARALHNIPHYMIEAVPWYENLRNGKTARIYASEMTGWIRAMMDGFEANSFLLVPIPQEGEDWCGVGFHSREERPWREEEESLLRAVASSLGAAMRRTRDEERKLFLERKVLEGQKLESLGVLAGGVAHDFNNLLMTMQGNLHLAMLDTPPNSSVRESLEGIRAACNYAGDMIRQLLNFSGRGRLASQPLELNTLVQEILSLVRVTLPENVRFECRFGGQLPILSGDPSQLRQVVLNLLTNAWESLDGGAGTLHLETGRLDADAAFLAGCVGSDGLRPGEYLFLRVRDCGRGMDAQTRAKIFDPFFTTKPAGRGLGLAAVLGIVRSHGGALSIESRVGQGSAFTVLVPLRPVVIVEESSPPSHEARLDS